MLFRARHFEIIFPRPALIMGIVNVTPDSFSDGGKFFDADAAVAHALELAAQGAEILDIGGESTRPGATSVSEAEELRRVIPVIEKLAKATTVALSIDTMKPAVARAALVAGASMVNDVAAHRGQDDMWKCVAEFHAGYICMHAPGSGDASAVELHQLSGAGKNPPTNIIRSVGEFFSERLTALLNEAGIAAEQVVLDPGIGFGKTVEENLQLLADLRNFTKWRRPLLVGASRKSFLEKITGATVNERLPASLACATLAVAAGAQIVRTHDVRETVQALRMAEAILSQKTNVA